MPTTNLVKKTKRKFLIFSILGMAIVFIMSAITYRYHQNVVTEQKNIHRLYQSLNKQLSLIQKIAIMADEFNQIQEASVEKKLKSEMQILVVELSDTQSLLDSYTVPHVDPDNDLSKEERTVLDKDFESKIDRYLDLANTLIQTDTNDISNKRQIINKINIKARGNLTKNLQKVFEDVDVRNEKSLNSLNRIAILLILLCTGEVFFIWILVFNPLYRAIILQNENINESKLSAESANRAKTDFLANISHEIRTPMTAILGYAEILSREKNNLSEDSLTAIATINKSSSHLLALIDDILNVSKIEAGKVEPEIKKINFVKLLKDIHELISVKAKEKKIQLVFNTKNEIPLKIHTDTKLLKQVLFNIIGNAIKFTKHGHVELQCSFDKDDHLLKLLVKDTGVGISKLGRKNLFKPFSQADTSHQRKYGGTGLGLILSRGICRTLGGDLKLLKSHEGKGSQFLITLNPGDLSDEVFVRDLFDIKNKKTDHEIIKNNSSSNNLLLNHHILVVDDAKENARLFKIYLEEALAKVDLAFDGDKAITLAKENQYDIILLDIQMPGKDGFQVIKELRQNGFSGPIKALTAHALPEEKKKTLNAGFNGHIIKPVSAETLIKECYTK